ncbi:MAG: hypothetical protein ABR517_14885 [Thermoanaerobaculia bacterium]
MNGGTGRGRSAAGGAALLALFGLALVAVRPRGEFPLNDDWNFAMATWHFAEHLEFRFARFTGMSLKLQVVWGALWTWLFGPSFEVLRASTIAVAFATLALWWRWSGELGWRASVRFLLATSLMAHPIFFWSSVTFMTQVPFLFLSMLAMYCTWKAYREESLRWAVAASIVVLSSCFIRQTGIAVALPGLLLPLIDRRYRATRRLAIPFVAACVAFALLYAGTNVFDGYPGQISVHYEAFRGGDGWIGLLTVPFHHLGTNIQYAALFFLPLTIAMVLTPPLPSRRWMAAALLLAVVPTAVASWHVSWGRTFPYRSGGSILENVGLGVMTLRDVYLLRLPYPTHLGWTSGLLLTVIAVAAGTLLLVRAIRAWAETDSAEPGGGDLAVRLGLLHSAAATVMLFPSSIYFDRYALDSLWSVLLWAPFAVRWRKSARIAAGAAAAALLLFSVAATHEYFAWNRARWEAFGWLRDRGVSLREMDGGYEINQYLLGGWDGSPDLDKPGFSVVDDRYVITFNPRLPGYRLIARFPYFGLLSGDEAVHVLEDVRR